MSEEITNSELLEAINAFANHTEKRFDGLENKIDGLDKRVTKIETTMVTKDFLEEKLADFRGDMVVLTRREDKKVMALVDILKEKKIISDEDVKKIQTMEPFAQTL